MKMTIAQTIEFGEAIMKLGSRVSAVGNIGVRRGRRGVVCEPMIVAFDVTEEERVQLGLMYIKDYGFSGHKVYAIA